MNQTRGLIAALGRLLPTRSREIPLQRGSLGVADVLRGRFTPGDGLPRPNLLIGAGHRTHAALLAARRAVGGRAVVLMRPTLPTGWFDLCLIPEHDSPPHRPNVVPTRGAINLVQRSDHAQPDRGLLLIGGPSASHRWDEAAILKQVETVVSRDGDRRWRLTTSRRTPESTTQRLERAGDDRLEVTPFAETGPGWVAEQIALSSAVWVSADSVSMIYESLTAGARVGLLGVPPRRENRWGRVARSVDRLVGAGWVTPFSEWANDGKLPPPPAPLNEAQRGAEEVARRLLGRAPSGEPNPVDYPDSP